MQATSNSKMYFRLNTRATIYLTLAYIAVLLGASILVPREFDFWGWTLYGLGLAASSIAWLSALIWVVVSDLQHVPFHRPTQAAPIMTVLVAGGLIAALTQNSDASLLSVWFIGGGVIVAWQLFRFSQTFPDDVRRNVRIVFWITVILVIAPTAALWVSQYVISSLSPWHVFLPILAKIFHIVWFAVVPWVFFCDCLGRRLLKFTKLNVVAVVVWTCLAGTLLYYIPTTETEWFHLMKPQEAFWIVEVTIIVLWLIIRGAVLSAKGQTRWRTGDHERIEEPRKLGHHRFQATVAMLLTVLLLSAAALYQYRQTKLDPPVIRALFSRNNWIRHWGERPEDEIEETHPWRNDQVRYLSFSLLQDISPLLEQADSLGNLKVVNISPGQIEPDEFAKLQQALPECTINTDYDGWGR